MKDEEIVEGNILIDKFIDDWLVGAGFTREELNYHSNWKTLIVVIKKIHSIGHGITLYRKGLIESSTIEQAWKAVVEFIKWYN